jgi:hypothetical protein
MLKLRIKDWEVYTGIKVINPKGFYGRKSKIRTNLYTLKAFMKGIQKSNISIKTDKGLEYFNSKELM